MIQKCLVSSFIEKPLESEAEIFAGQQDYLWNSGIFVAKSEAVLNQLEQHMPEFYNKCHMVASSIRQHSNEVVFKKEQYDKFPLISIEKAIFEKHSSSRLLLPNLNGRIWTHSKMFSHLQKEMKKIL